MYREIRSYANSIWDDNNNNNTVAAENICQGILLVQDLLSVTVTFNLFDGI